MFCEVEHLVMTSVQVNAGMLAYKCAPVNETKDAVSQRKYTFNPS